MRYLTRWPIALVAAAVLATACSADTGTEPATPSDTTTTTAPTDLAVAVASFDLAVEEQARFIAGLLTPEREMIGFGRVEMRFAFLGEDGQATPTFGPPTEATFLPVPGRSDPEGPTDRARQVEFGEGAGVYQTQIDLDHAGLWTVAVAAELADGTTRQGTATFRVAARHQVPAVGDRAPRSDNLTVDSAADPAAIDSRAINTGQVPDPVLHGTTVADAVAAGRPAVVVISTPVYCVSRFCGPITETVEALAERYRDRAEFIHLEVWKDFDAQTLNDAAAEWILTDDGGNEPWTFLVDPDGTIAARWDNVVDVADLERQLGRLPVIADGD